MYDYLHIGTAKDLIDPHQRRVYRLFEILPGALAWVTLAGVVAISYVVPAFAALFIIAFDIYWLVKTIFLTLHMRSTFARMRRYMRRDWVQELRALTASRASGLEGLEWGSIYHLVILPMAFESWEVVRQSIESLAGSNYPLDRFIVVLGVEARAGARAREIAADVQREFGSHFYRFLMAIHPDDLPGEIPGKGSNESWAGERAKELIDSLGIPYRAVVVSVFDIDTVAPPDFFACLAWHYLTAERPLRSSFQPVPLFINNIWEAPAFARVFAFSTTFWNMIQQARQEQLVTFSSQSISFQAIVEVGFWQRNVVSEDSRIFWQCLLAYDGDWCTVPLYYPVYMDANVAPTFWQTVKNQYKQILRWHYGAENNPYFMFGFLRNKRIPPHLKRYHRFVQTERTHSSPTNAIIIFLLGWLPLVIGRGGFSQTVLSYNLPEITRWLMGIAMLGLVTSAMVSIILLPPRPPNYGKFKWLWMFLQWVLFPIHFIFFGAIPALDAQTRLMFGKYMGFWTTPKNRIEKKE